MTKIVYDKYKIMSEGVPVEIHIVKQPKDFVLVYHLNLPEFGIGTQALLDDLRVNVLSNTALPADKMSDPKFLKETKKKIYGRMLKVIKKEVPMVSDENKEVLVSFLLQDMLGLGRIDYLLEDPNLEEIVINSAAEPIWVYHKRFGWLKSNIFIESEAKIQNYSSIIARRVKKQISTLHPLLDAHLVTGDRANATLFPVSSNGNTLTIRKFRRDPWTAVDFMDNNTVNPEVMAVIWQAFEYELNVIVSGGTASGKTSFLNVCLPFIQPNQRVISIEDTRELRLPSFLHWVPLTTREKTSEDSRGEVTMLDLLINSLRMRPDRIIIGETRRKEEAEVMFEGMHTGHAVYTTVHANTAMETINRLTTPPISVSKNLLEAVHLNVVMFRNRRIGARRMLHLAEFVMQRRGDKVEVVPHTIYRWNPANDRIVKRAEPIRLFDELGLYTGSTVKEVKEEISSKEKILEWMQKHQIKGIDKTGHLMAQYYSDKEQLLELVNKDKVFDEEQE